MATIPKKPAGKTASTPVRASSTNEIFTLEALNAQHGDALLLHFGTRAKPHHLLIDGGPVGVYTAALKPRLAQIAAARKLPTLPLDHVFVTHLDSDHIKGVLDLVTDIRKGGAPADCESFWFNTFSDAMKQLPPELAALRADVADASDEQLASSKAVLASVPEGQALRDAVASLHGKVNGGGGQQLFADTSGVALNVSPLLKVTLVCPSKEHLRKLAADWKQKAKPTQAETAAYVDQSVYNLSSLVMVVEAKGSAGKSARMLLTGDARGDHVLEGLKLAGFPDAQGKAHFDVMKVAHHGSDRDFDAAFFKTVTADHYVISANGRFDNPSEPVLEWIALGATGTYTVHLTNESSTGFPALDANIARAEKNQPALRAHMNYRAAHALSVKVDLFKPITF